jgi:hypothetical protein
MIVYMKIKSPIFKKSLNFPYRNQKFIFDRRGFHKGGRGRREGRMDELVKELREVNNGWTNQEDETSALLESLCYQLESESGIEPRILIIITLLNRRHFGGTKKGIGKTRRSMEIPSCPN